MNRLPQGASEPGWGKVGPHFLTNSERPARSKYEDLKTWRMCHRTIESASFGNLPISVRRQPSTWKERETRPNCEPATPSTLWSVFRLARTRLRTTAQLDFSWPQVVCNSNKNQAEGGGVSRVAPHRTCDKNMSKCHFLRSCQKFKDSEDASAGKGIFF